MKKLTYLFLALLIVACSDGGDGGNDGCPINFECSTATANDFLNLEDVTEDYQSLVNQFGDPISEGLVYDEFDDNYYYSWTFNFDDNDIICLNVSCSDCSYIIYGGCD